MTDSSHGFVPQIEHMDLSRLTDKTFAVSVSSGDRDKQHCVISALRGPFDFMEMVEYVADLWAKEMHHSKVYILNKEFKTKIEWLDAKTVDYIIERSTDIIMGETLLSEKEPYTCVAGVESEADEN